MTENRIAINLDRLTSTSPWRTSFATPATRSAVGSRAGSVSHPRLVITCGAGLTPAEARQATQVHFHVGP